MRSRDAKSKWSRLIVVVGVLLLAIGVSYFGLAYNKDVKAEEDKPTETELAEEVADEAAFYEAQQECVPVDEFGDSQACNYDEEYVSVDARYRENKAEARGMQVIGGLAIALGGIAIITGVLIRVGGKRHDTSSLAASPGGASLPAARFCSRCGSPISVGSHFCSACGSQTQAVEEAN